jgi:UDP-glucose 6-dehydrogenase
VQAFIALGRQLELPMGLLGQVMEVNERQPEVVGRGLDRVLGGLGGHRVIVLGLAFKPGTDDVRESRALPIIRDLIARGARVTAHDPIAADAFAAYAGQDAPSVTYVSDWRAEVAGSDAIVIATNWADYRELAHCDLRGKVLYDSRRLFGRPPGPGVVYLSVGLGRLARPATRPHDAAPRTPQGEPT